VTFLVLLATARSRAEDTVVLASREGRGQVRSVGQVVDFTGSGLILRRASGREERIPAERVIALESQWTEAHSEADQRFENAEFDRALELYGRALAAEQRGWVRRLILSRCVWCDRRLGRWDRAGDSFLLISEQDPATPYFHAIPLPWTTPAAPPSLESRAQRWMKSTQPAAQLLGASWLVTTPQRTAALAMLRQLTNNAQPEIAFLADAQSWRTRVVTATTRDAQRWRERIERMPSKLRGGPLYLRGQLLTRLGRHEEAALSLLEVAILHRQHYELAAQSLLAAGRELETMGQRDEADRLYEEITTSYAASNAVDTAQQRLRQSD
jgi:tetratricopeptide (TPR) repeat protein